LSATKKKSFETSAAELIRAGLRHLLRRQEVHVARLGRRMHQVPVEGLVPSQRLQGLRVRQALRRTCPHGQKLAGTPDAAVYSNNFYCCFKFLCNLTFQQGDQKFWKKFTKILEKVANTIAKPQTTKMSTSNLNLKVQNIYIKPLLRLKNTCNKPYFKTAYFGENVSKCCHFLGLIYLFKKS
jgi:hypothetical protein